ncbi:MAG: iron-containing redox enzyme family protein [Pigmentiphaga sp.]
MAHAEQDLMARLRGPHAPHLLGLGTAGAPDHGASLTAHDAKELYFGLLHAQPDAVMLAQARDFLSRQMAAAAHTDADLPSDMSDLALWMKSNSAAVGRQYRDYLAHRRNGGPRRYFQTKSHALYFLKAVAPTKLVDGAWLYGVVPQWRDARYAELIRIYLEELGDGDPGRNHVLLYKALLASHECRQWEALDASHFVQGAIQLSLAQHTEELVPEVIGFNLGYEQLPLHLLICAYELNELGIDPYYFTLHVTIDNAASGHAARAAQSVLDALPHLGDQEAFYRRVRDGYRLNAMGKGTLEVIAGFDLERELLAMLATKAPVGASLHSDSCRIGGRTVNEWLSTPGQMRDFVNALEKAGWIRRHEPPENSRFWALLTGDKGPMFGVFNAYERQLIHDWIAGDSLSASSLASDPYRNRERSSAAWRKRANACPGPEFGEELRFTDDGPRSSGFAALLPPDDVREETRLLRDTLAKAKNRAAAMDLLVPWLSPVHHHTPAGLLATRLFNQALRA